ncbi:hypothetical protein BC940DRAFT_296097 [Gongronella butleri]|nr:hypothetical protein BC940DRAFT_296097 [Gongronella butleri]
MVVMVVVMMHGWVRRVQHMAKAHARVGAALTPLARQIQRVIGRQLNASLVAKWPVILAKQRNVLFVARHGRRIRTNGCHRGRRRSCACRRLYARRCRHGRMLLQWPWGSGHRCQCLLRMRRGVCIGHRPMTPAQPIKEPWTLLLLLLLLVRMEWMCIRRVMARKHVRMLQMLLLVFFRPRRG